MTPPPTWMRVKERHSLTLSVVIILIVQGVEMTYLSYCSTKKNSALGSVYEDIKKFNTLFPNEAKIFNCGLEQICALYK